MTMRWIWLVHSKICITLASRMYRSAGWSQVYPAPPSTWTASVVTFMAASVATSLAMLACRASSLPASLRRGGPAVEPRGDSNARGLSADGKTWGGEKEKGPGRGGDTTKKTLLTIV